MSVNLINSDITLMRDRYDEALKMQGIPATYQYPIGAETNVEAESLIDHFSIAQDIYIFFDGTPKIKTYKRLGWVVENDEQLPFLIHCSFNLEHLQRDCLFKISGYYSEMPNRLFKVTEITTDLQCPDHVICKVVPVYDKHPTGRTKREVQQTFNKSNTFLQDTYDYRGDYYGNSDKGD